MHAMLVNERPGIAFVLPPLWPKTACRTRQSKPELAELVPSWHLLEAGEMFGPNPAEVAPTCAEVAPYFGKRSRPKKSAAKCAEIGPKFGRVSGARVARPVAKRDGLSKLGLARIVVQLALIIARKPVLRAASKSVAPMSLQIRARSADFGAAFRTTSGLRGVSGPPGDLQKIPRADDLEAPDI